MEEEREGKGGRANGWICEDGVTCLTSAGARFGPEFPQNLTGICIRSFIVSWEIQPSLPSLLPSLLVLVFSSSRSSTGPAPHCCPVSLPSEYPLICILFLSHLPPFLLVRTPRSPDLSPVLLDQTPVTLVRFLRANRTTPTAWLPAFPRRQIPLARDRWLKSRARHLSHPLFDCL